MKELLERMRSSLPKYNLKQPSSGKIISYRPFTVKEEKVLLMATTTGTYEDFLSTLTDIIDDCFSLQNESRNLPLFDIEYFFIKLRCKSIGEIVEPIITCPYTGEKVKVNLNLEDIEPILNEDHKQKIELNGNIIVTMKYPSVDNIIKNRDKVNDYFDLVIQSILSIETDQELIETSNYPKSSLIEFVELLTDDQYRKLISFFKTMPKLEKSVKYRTSDEVEREIVLKGLKDFFR